MLTFFWILFHTDSKVNTRGEILLLIFSLRMIEQAPVHEVVCYEGLPRDVTCHDGRFAPCQ
jgi:hypothetical protein